MVLLAGVFHGMVLVSCFVFSRCFFVGYLPQVVYLLKSFLCLVLFLHVGGVSRFRCFCLVVF